MAGFYDNLSWSGMFSHFSTHKKTVKMHLHTNFINEVMTFLEARDLLRVWRENSERQSRDVVDIWESILMNHIDKLGNESKLQSSGI